MGDKEKHSILLVDDEETILESLAYALKSAGEFDVEYALGGKQGIQKFSEREHDLVISDLNMSGIDGIQVLKEVKKRRPDSAVIILTGCGSLQTSIAAFSEGASDYLLKPCASEELIFKVRKCLDQFDLKKKMQRQSDELAEANNKLAVSNRELESFVSLASHDLQEPLRKIKVFGEKLHVCIAHENDNAKGNLDRILNAVERMQNLIDDLLTLSRAATNKGFLKKVDLNKTIKDVLDTLELRVAQTQADVIYKDLHVIFFDPTHISQLLQNLVGNALKYHKKDIPPIVRIESKNLENKFLELIIEDQGIGFEDTHKERIFKPFERLNNRSLYEGSGMGLAICKKIVELYDGKIEAKSELGKGSQFKVTLPVKFV